MRKYTLNEEYFDDIATPEQAYWLGFITADGCITCDAKTKALRFTLKGSDIDHLRWLACSLDSDAPARLLPRTGRLDEAVISFHSTYLVQSLGKLGISERKSLLVRPWEAPQNLAHHYWRGLFDGDGTIFYTRSVSEWTVGICGSLACVEGFARWARPIADSRSVTRKARKDSECWQWTCMGGKKPQAIAKALYVDASIALPRKAIRATELCNIDYDSRHAEANAVRAQKMRIAWETGRHPRSKVGR